MQVKKFLGVVLTGMFSFGIYASQLVPIMEGVHYQRIPGLVRAPSVTRVEVLEFFSYGCPHCYHFDPMLQKWAETSPIPIDLVRVPVTFRPGWEIYASAYYTAESFNKLDKIHMDFFKAVQGGQPLMSLDALTRFFAKHGIAPDQFIKTFDSFGVHTKISSALKMAIDYRVSAVPTVVVNRKYVTHTGLVGNYEGLLAVLDVLAQKEIKKSQIGK